MLKVMRFVLVGAFLSLSFNICFAEVITPESTITRVSVYPGSARITRQAQVNLSEGEHTIVFDNIIPMIDQNSLSISGQGNAQVKLYGASFKTTQLAVVADERVKDLDAQIEILADQISLQNMKMTIVNQQKEFINSVKLTANQQIPEDIMTKMPTAQDLSGIFDFIGNGLQGLNDKQEAIRLEIRRLSKEKDVLEREMSQLRGGNAQKAKRSIEVELSCQAAGAFTLETSYMVMGPGWRPVYDARAGFNPSQVEMVQYAMVQQNTGEDWSNVDVTLSTVQPLLGGRMPYVDSWIVRPAETRRSEGGMLGRALKGSLQIGRAHV